MQMDNINPILLTDAYKIGHWLQYPQDTKVVYSYLESRGGESSATRFFGLQAILKRYLLTPIAHENIDEAVEQCQKVFGYPLFNEQGWRYIVDQHDGRLPVRIKAVPEGSVVPVSNVLMTVENTDPNVPWLTNYIESLLLQVWYPTTVCTQSYRIGEIIDKYCKKTGVPTQPIPPE